MVTGSKGSTKVMLVMEGGVDFRDGLCHDQGGHQGGGGVVHMSATRPPIFILFLGRGRVAARGLYRRRVAESVRGNFCGIFSKLSI